MIGSTIIFETDPTTLQRIREDLDALDNFAHVELDVMLTLDFEVICSAAKIEWTVGEPAVLDEENGLVITPVSEKGLDYLLSHTDGLDPEQLGDIARLSEFLGEHGKEHIYEMSTF